MVSTSSLKNLQKTRKCPFQTLTKLAFEAKIRSKSFSNKLPTPKFGFKQSWTFCFTFPENGFHFVTQQFAKKTEKCPFQTITTLVSELKIASKPFCKNLPMTKLCFKWLCMLCLTFPENGFNFFNEKFAKN